MANHWHMNRMGFINFWLYDEEYFSFADGKLLLRGQNGSGKSITTQSFIPFILDGDRTPSRLDPFGSGDRKMEYYFLGEGEKEDSTGYLFLEFKKEGIEQYRTIGIGQRAQRGKPMSFWGFILLDGRRISYDLNLYREVGEKRIPYTKRELKEVIGERNIYTEAQKEYMELVNKYLFGFAEIEQYNQFIKLLIKVRAPKLSKEFKPTKVYELLNESLQVLSDDDMRAMVEAMEKMDEIQYRLDNLKAALKDLTSIRTEYNRYNRYMLAKKAEAYIAAKNVADAQRKSQITRESGKRRLMTKIEDLKQELSVLDKKKAELTEELNSLNTEDIDELVRRRKDAIEAKALNEKEKERIDLSIEACRTSILEHDRKLREHADNAKATKNKIKAILENLDKINEEVRFSLHSELKELETSEYREIELRRLDKELEILRDTVRKGYEALKEMSRIKLQLDSEMLKLQRAVEKKREAERGVEAFRLGEEKARDEIVETFYVLQSQNIEMAMTRQDVENMSEMIRKYAKPADIQSIRDYFYGIWKKKNDANSAEKLMLESRITQLKEKKRDLLKELEEIRNMKMAVPIHSDRVAKAREVLSNKNIRFLPFYEAIDFRENLPQEKKNRLEAQLYDAGILDALIVAEGDMINARRELSELSDVIISPEGKEGEPYPHIKAVAEDMLLLESTNRVLKHVRYIDTDEPMKIREIGNGNIVLGDDGYFKNGILEGYSNSDSEASYIGALARQKAKEKLIRDKEEEIDILEGRLESEKNALDKVEEVLDRLKEQLSRFPDFEILDRAIDDLNEGIYVDSRCGIELDEKERDVEQIRSINRDVEREIVAICKLLPYARKKDSYETVIEAISEYAGNLRQFESLLRELGSQNAKQDNEQELIDKEEERRDEQYYFLKIIEKRINELQAQIDVCNEYLDNPEIEEMSKRVDGLREELDGVKTRMIEKTKEIEFAGNEISRIDGEIELHKEEIAKVETAESITRKYFHEESDLDLVVGIEGESDYEIAQNSLKVIRESDKNNHAGEMTASLMKVFSAHSSTLSSYGTVLEECFKNENTDYLRVRLRIIATWNGQKLYLEDFHEVLKESVESTELIIREKDREIFEDILSGTLSRKLNSRIKESKNWIRDMSRLMRDMDTSMALTFSLDWRPRVSEGEFEMDTSELEKILARDKELLTDEDIKKVSIHFRNKINIAKQNAIENGEDVNYMQMIRDALDYRQWFEFRMNYYRNNENKKELTNGAFNRFSGGEKAMAMYVPLFAAVNAQYKKASAEDHPRIIALDEAFAGVDDKNISSMFELVHYLNFDYVMNSQVLWGCYESVKSLRISELLRPANTDVVTIINYHWNGRERILCDE